jgi:uncharacterized protein YdeI (YjbR/CyaY-like superfamily)
LVVRCYKVRAGDRGMTHPQAVDEALCFGWIDGIRRSLDGVSFTVRFTPRKPRSIWSRVNLARVKALAAEGRMAPSGRAAFEARDPRRTGIYSFERAALKLTPAFARRLRADAAAWAFFQSQPPWYRRVSTFWVMSAVKEATRLRRLATLIAYSAGGRSIRPLDRTKAGK